MGYMTECSWAESQHALRQTAVWREDGVAYCDASKGTGGHVGG